VEVEDAVCPYLPAGTVTLGKGFIWFGDCRPTGSGSVFHR